MPGPRGADYARKKKTEAAKVEARKKKTSGANAGAQARLQADAAARSRAQSLRRQQNARNKQKDAYDAQATAAKLRAAKAKGRPGGRQRHVVTKTDTPESIAAQYDISPQDVTLASGVRLRAGQSIDLSLGQSKYGYAGEGKAYTDYMSRVEQEKNKPRADNITEWYNKRDEDIRREGVGAINPTLDIASGVPDIYLPSRRDTEDVPYVDTQRDLDKRNMGRLQKQYQQKAKNAFDFQVRVHSLRGKYRMAEEAWFEDDMSLRPDSFTDWELSQFSKHVQDRILNELGYHRDAEGKWVPNEILDEDYGMGGYSFPGYGAVGGGGGVGGALTGRGSSYGGRKSGGRSRLSSSKMFAGSVPRSHWRVG